MDTILQDLHEGVMGAYLGKDKTFEWVKERFYWPGYYEDISEWERTCSNYETRKTSTPQNRVPIQSVKVGSPMQLIEVDILGPFLKKKEETSIL